MEKKDDEKLILAKLNDKIRICKTRNRIVNTEFLNIHQENIIRKELERLKEKNFYFTGGFEEAESKLLIIYPNKLTEEIATDNIGNIIKAIQIILPNEQKGKYAHRDYLGTIMSFGLERERIGDILVYDDKAFILVLKENAEYIKTSLQDTIKFKKSKIEVIDINRIEVKQPELEEIKISVSSERLDNFVSEIAKISRKMATDLIERELVSINCKVESKQTKLVNKGDILIIRGYGKFIIGEGLNINKKGKQIIIIKKYK